MKLIDLIDNIRKDDKNSVWVDLEEIANWFDICAYNFKEEGADRLKAYMLTSWLCTDTWVGTNVYFLDDQPVCITKQSARKSDVNFYWVSLETYHLVRQYICDMMQSVDAHPAVIDLDEEMGEGYPITYSQQILGEDAIYQGQAVEIAKKYWSFEEVGDWEKVNIAIPNQPIIKVGMNELLFPYHIDVPKET